MYTSLDFKTEGRIPLPIRMNFWKSAKGGEGGVTFNPKIYIADFGNFKEGFLIMKLIQNSNFWVQGMFFNNCIEKNQNKTHFEEDTFDSSESPPFQKRTNFSRKVHEIGLDRGRGD